MFAISHTLFRSSDRSFDRSSDRSFDRSSDRSFDRSFVDLLCSNRLSASL